MISRIRKTLVAAGAAIVSIGALANDTDGISTQDKYAIAAIVVGVIGVYFTPNSDGETSDDLS